MLVSFTNFGAGAALDDPVPSLAHPNRTAAVVIMPIRSVPERLVLGTLGLNHTGDATAVRHCWCGVRTRETHSRERA